jgi:hypothetical protein
VPQSHRIARVPPTGSVCASCWQLCACVRNRTERSKLGWMANVIYIRSHRSVLVERLGKALREMKRDILDQPLPERWADLIKQLNAKEEAGRKAD